MKIPASQAELAVAVSVVPPETWLAFVRVREATCTPRADVIVTCTPAVKPALLLDVVPELTLQAPTRAGPTFVRARHVSAVLRVRIETLVLRTPLAEAGVLVTTPKIGTTLSAAVIRAPSSVFFVTPAANPLVATLCTCRTRPLSIHLFGDVLID